MATIKPSLGKRSETSRLIQNLKRFLNAQKETLLARASTPAMHGINLVETNFTPSRLAEHPGCCSHEDIEPMK
jgi:hypothetical protein